MLKLIFAFFTILFYSVIASWTVAYIAITVFNLDITFEALKNNPYWMISIMLVFMLITLFIVKKGVSEGIEKIAKIMMPLLFVILLFIIARVLSLDGAEKGIAYYFSLDFNKINTKVI